MPNLGPMEILVVLIVALIVLGPKRLPEAGRQVGRAVAEVRRWSNTMQAEVRAVLDTDVEAPPPVPWNPPAGTRLQPPAPDVSSADVSDPEVASPEVGDVPAESRPEPAAAERPNGAAPEPPADPTPR